MSYKLYKKNTTTNEETYLNVTHSYSQAYIDDQSKSITLSSDEIFVHKWEE